MSAGLSLVPRSARAVVAGLVRNRRRLAAYGVLVLVHAACASLVLLVIRKLIQAAIIDDAEAVVANLGLLAAFFAATQLGGFCAKQVALALERTVTEELLLEAVRSSLHSAEPGERKSAHDRVLLFREGQSAIPSAIRAGFALVADAVRITATAATALWLAPAWMGADGLALAVLFVWTLRHAQKQRLGEVRALTARRQLHQGLHGLMQSLPLLKLFDATESPLNELLVPLRQEQAGEHAILWAERRMRFELQIGGSLIALALIVFAAAPWSIGAPALDILAAVTVAHLDLVANIQQLAANGLGMGRAFIGLDELLPPSSDRTVSARVLLDAPIAAIEAQALAFDSGLGTAAFTFALQRGHLYVVDAAPAAGTRLLRILSGGLSAGGELAMNGVPIAELDRATLDQRVALVSWPPAVIDGTLRDNLLIVSPRSSDGALWSVLESVALTSHLLDTRLGRKGVQLSTGELARLALVRAFLANPDVVLIDDLFGGLDSVSFAAVHGALERFAVDGIVVCATTDARLIACARAVIRSEPAHRQSAEFLRPDVPPSPHPDM